MEVRKIETEACDMLVYCYVISNMTQTDIASAIGCCPTRIAKLLRSNAYQIYAIENEALKDLYNRRKKLAELKKLAMVNHLGF